MTSLRFISPKTADRKLRGVYASIFTLSLLFKVQKVVVVVVVKVVVVVVCSSSSSSDSTSKAIPIQVWTGPMASGGRDSQKF